MDCEITICRCAEQRLVAFSLNECAQAFNANRLVNIATIMPFIARGGNDNPTRTCHLAQHLVVKLLVSVQSLMTAFTERHHAWLALRLRIVKSILETERIGR